MDYASRTPVSSHNVLLLPCKKKREPFYSSGRSDLLEPKNRTLARNIWILWNLKFIKIYKSCNSDVTSKDLLRHNIFQIFISFSGHFFIILKKRNIIPFCRTSLVIKTTWQPPSFSYKWKKNSRCDPKVPHKI